MLLEKRTIPSVAQNESTSVCQHLQDLCTTSPMHDHNIAEMIHRLICPGIAFRGNSVGGMTIG